MRIPESLIQEIREKVDIVDVIGDYVALEKRGRNHVACCPFHEEKTPSFSVSEDKQIYYCFGCHEGGNVYNFLMKHEGLGFQEAVIQVAEYAKIDVSSYQNVLSTSQIKQQTNSEYYELNKFVSEFYEYMLMTEKGKSAKQYLEKRGIHEDEIKQFHIGYAPEEHLLGKLLEEKGFSLELAKELGLLHEAKAMTHYYDSFAGRIVFPITDMQGNPVAFTGRLIQDKKESPKYYHSPESKIFQKREILYNFSVAESEIKRHKHVYICEGIFDVIAMYRAGLKHAVASLGTAITTEQLQFLQKKHIETTFIFDNDSAGKKALVKAVNLALSRELTADVVTFWEYEEKDLDEICLKYGASKVKLIAENRMQPVDYLMQYYENFLNLENNEERQEYARNILEALTYCGQATKEFYYAKLQEKTQYSVAALNTLQKQVNVVDEPDYYDALEPEPYMARQVIPQRRPKNRQFMCELLIVKGICFDEECLKIYQGSPVLSQNMIFRKLIYEMLELYRKSQQVDVSQLYQVLNDEESQFLSQALYLEEPMTKEIFKDLLVTLKYESEQRFFKEEVSNITSDSDKQKEILQKYLEFKIKNSKIKGE